MKKHEVKKNEFGYFELKAKDLQSARELTPGFRAIDGSKVLSERLVRKYKKHFDCIVISWPCRDTDSFLKITNVATLVFTYKGCTIEARTWDPFDPMTGDCPNIEFRQRYPVIEVHDLSRQLMGAVPGFDPDDPTCLLEREKYDGPLTLQASSGFAPLPPQQDIDEYFKCILPPNRVKLYFRKKNEAISQLLEIANEFCYW
ncbi:MAG: hypothetical protein Q4A70_04070 [Candidatus Saccharibacteria bacterium]|nr:hypothetical protein [Candidatus Saccharibacteria bacterium]